MHIATCIQVHLTQVNCNIFCYSSTKIVGVFLVCLYFSKSREISTLQVRFTYMLSDPFSDQNWAQNFVESLERHSNAWTNFAVQVLQLFFHFLPKILVFFINKASEIVIH